MSADNTIALLSVQTPDGKPWWLVAHLGYSNTDDYETPDSMRAVARDFALAPIFGDKEAALEYAWALYESLPFVEYGITEFDMSLPVPDFNWHRFREPGADHAFCVFCHTLRHIRECRVCGGMACPQHFPEHDHAEV